jgi:hypothetical protein
VSIQLTHASANFVASDQPLRQRISRPNVAKPESRSAAAYSGESLPPDLIRLDWGAPHRRQEHSSNKGQQVELRFHRNDTLLALSAKSSG